MKTAATEREAMTNPSETATETKVKSGEATVRELDALVAEKVMDWAWYNSDQCSMLVPRWFRWTKDKLSPSPSHANKRAITGLDFRAGVSLPYYSTDIAAAMEVVERVIAEGSHPLFNYFGENARGDHWNVTIYRIGGDAARSVSEIAPTLPRAICLAALAAIRGNAENEGDR